MENATTLDDMLKAITICLESPLILEDVTTRRKSLEAEQKVTRLQEKMYTPNTKQLFKQFSL